MRFNVIQLKSGAWAVSTRPGSYFINGVFPTEREARIDALHRKGQWHQAQIDKVDNALRALGALDETDPHGYMA